MKGVIKIPAQEIVFDFQPIWEVDPPKDNPVTVEPPTVTPSPVEEPKVVNYTEKFYQILNDKEVSDIYLNEGSTYVIDILKQVKVNRKLRIWSKDNRATLIIGKENYDQWNDGSQAGALFMLEDGADLLIENVNICQPKQEVSNQPWQPSLFTSVTNPNVKWKAIVKNCDTTAIGRHGGFGLGFLYGSKEVNLVGAINVKHLGSGFTQAKASIGDNKDGILKIYLKDVVTDQSEEEFGVNYQKVRGYVKNNVFTITSEHTTRFLNNHFFINDKNDNHAHILHIGRFTFMIDDIEAIINDKQIRLRPNANGNTRIKVVDGKIYTIGKESHAGDKVLDVLMTQKWRDEHPVWSNNFNPKGSDISYHPFLKNTGIYLDGYHNVNWTSSWDQEGIEQDAYLVVKGNSHFRSYPDTKFGNWEILSGAIVGHSMYNHAEITLYAENVIQKGYYRQTRHLGKSLGYWMIDCQGFKNEFSPSVPIKSDRMSLEEFEKLK